MCLIFLARQATGLCACRQKPQIRLSMDVRYQPIDEPGEAKSLLPHCNLNWEEIYLDWENENLKCYLRNLP